LLARELTRHTLSEDQIDAQARADEAAAAAAAEAPVEDFETRVRAVDLAAEDVRTRVLAPAELVSVLMRECPQLGDAHSDGKLVIGLVGYPNVGKSSTINALVGSKKVNVGAMPGKTKHFQTIHLTSDVVLCDCPGLVFPTFATTKADMVCNGVLPIDQLREFSGPCALIAQRIPKRVLEAVYGIAIRTRPEDEGGSGVPTAEELLISYAAARGLFKAGEGNPDESRAARVLLKDYVSGKLIFCHPPPGFGSNAAGSSVADPNAADSNAADSNAAASIAIDSNAAASIAIDFNAEHYDLANVARSSHHVVADPDSGALSVKHAASDRRSVQRSVLANSSSRIDALDRGFFNNS
ncbi:hypothetical protein GGF43_006859, partial [Coemansia sp. RSA 2618]